MRSTKAQLALLLLLAACARIEVPPGGPPDRRAPQLLEVSPLSGSVNQDLRPVFRFRFDEYLNRSAAAQELHLSPLHPGGLSIRWLGRTMIVQPKEALQPNQTYVLEAGSGLKDFSGNSLAQSIQIAFSTGAELDSFAFEGHLSFGSDGARPLIWVWPLEEFPQHPLRGALWQTRPDALGNFRLSHMAERKYRLFAVDDQNGNRQWDYPAEYAATADTDIIPGEQSFASLRLAPLVLDSLSLLSLEVLDRHHLRIRGRLDLPATPGRANQLKALELRDSLGRYVSLLDLREDELGVYRLLCDPLDSLSYTLSLLSGTDSLRVWGSTKSQNAFGSLQTSTTLDTENKLDWQSSFALKTAETPSPYLRNGLRRDSLSLTHGDSWTLILDCARWQDGDSLVLPAHTLEDWAGNQWPDSTKVLALIPAKETPEGSLELVPDRLPLGNWRLAIMQQDSVIRDTDLEKVILLKNLPEGLLSLALYKDRNEDRRWTPGTLDPFRFAEPWLDLPADTIRILSGWTQEEQPLRLPLEVN